jgi:hypothetical protein
MTKSGVIDMEWGTVGNAKKAHCFSEIDHTGVGRSLCNHFVSFTIRPIEETSDDDVHTCFTCLLLFIKSVGVKP